ncbi:MAG TPA: alcohol dehydrogenase catalytic domain-containing protein [Acidobacteriaceae bacterium]
MIAERPAETMLAAVLHGSEDLRMERIPMPRAGEGEIVVRVGAALTCGTDLKVYRRGYHAMMLKPPLVFGHELAGTVVEVGAGVTRFALGDRVLPMNSAPCDACFFCNHGQQNLCEALLFNNGAYAEFLSVPARIVEKNTMLVPDHVPLEHAALTEPLACVVLGFNESVAQAGDTMAVIGAGPIGLMFMHVAQLRGVRVIAVVKRDDQIAAARLFGASEIVQIADGVDVVAAVRQLTGDARGADVVIEAVATPATWESAVAMVRKGGVVNFFGGPPSGTVVGLDTNRLHYGDITLKASFHHTPAACASAFSLVCGGKFKATEFITRTAKLEDVPAVFARMMTRSADNRVDIKTAIFPNGIGRNGGGQ